jgi:hypothetical protein
MLNLILISSLVTPILAGIALIFRKRRRAKRTVSTSEVCRQYVYLFRGGQLSESAVQSARVSLEALLERGDVRQVETALRPGKQFAVQARALTDIGSEPARVILERQLERPIGADPLEQGWYRLDLARCLRKLNRLPSMTALIRAAAGPEAPLIQFLAAETVCFPGFSGFMFQLDLPIGRNALLVLLRVLRGLRNGVEPRIVGAGRLGEVVQMLWDQRIDGVDPLALRIFVEVRRLLARAAHAERWFGLDEPARAAFRQQIEIFESLADAMAEYLDGAADQLLDQLADAPADEQRDILQALTDLRADTARVVIPLLECGSLAARDAAVASLARAPAPNAGVWICDWAKRHVRRGRAVTPDFPYLAVLRALRSFPSAEAESTLLAATNSRDASVRTAALSSLGWWVPVNYDAVITRLKEARFDRVTTVQNTAYAALARLGERQALRWFRQQLAGDSPEPIHRVIQLVAEEGILLLWPDLDALADAEDTDIAFHACEALEQLNEDLSVSGSAR